MGMVVRTNTMAMNANRQLGINNTQVGKSLEKLSSGFRINRAADDASGLAISEKMKAQIKGLEQAAANSQDGISLIQTAEGATQEIHNMLNRMVELATKSANGTIQNPVDREAIQREVDDLNSEITRISESTNFNGINLLDGSLGEGGQSLKASGTVGGKNITITEAGATKTSAKTDALTFVAAGDVKLTFKYKDKNGVDQSEDIKYTTATDTKTSAAALKAALGASKAAGTFDFDVSDAGIISITSKTAGKSDAAITSMAVDAQTSAKFAGGATATLGTKVTGADKSYTADLSGTFAAGDKISVGGKTFTFTTGADGTDGKTFADLASLATAAKKNNITANVATNTAVTFTSDKGAGLKLQVGDTNDDFNHVTVSVDNLSAAGIGTNGLDVSTQDAAGDSVQTVKDAINKVSTNRANLGSLQNRLEYTINNLDTTTENMTAANSRIRDTDMAKEMMNYTKMNILTQAAQAMLAQANQQPQAILQLLQ